MWAGVRATYGVKKGKIAYECKILEHLNVDHLPDEERTRHVVRVGFSTDECSMQLGMIFCQLKQYILKVRKSTYLNFQVFGFPNGLNVIECNSIFFISNVHG